MIRKAVIYLSLLALLFQGTYANAGVFKKARKAATVVVVGAAVAAAAAGIGAVVMVNKLKCRSSFDPRSDRPTSSCPSTDSTQDAEPIEDDGEGAFGLNTYKNTTAKLKKALNEEIRNLPATGSPPPPQDPKDCAAHHIVPQEENRKWAKDLADDARDSIDGCVDMHSAENGIYLPHGENKKKAECKGTDHNRVHRRSYYEDISVRLNRAKRYNGCSGVRDELQSIKNELSSGKIWPKL